MNHRHMLLVVSVLIFAGCDEVAHQGSPAETDAFLRNALDTYGVIDVVPSAPIAGRAQSARAGGPPLDAAGQGAGQRLSIAEACEGKTGIQRGLRDTRTGQWLDCGPSQAQS